MHVFDDAIIMELFSKFLDCTLFSLRASYIFVSCHGCFELNKGRNRISPDLFIFIKSFQCIAVIFNLVHLTIDPSIIYSTNPKDCSYESMLGSSLDFRPFEAENKIK